MGGGGQKKSFKDCLKELLKDLDIKSSTWESLAQDHTQLGVAKSSLRVVRQKTDGPQMRRGNAPCAKPTSLQLHCSFHTLMFPHTHVPCEGKSSGLGLASQATFVPTDASLQSEAVPDPDLEISGGGGGGRGGLQTKIFPFGLKIRGDGSSPGPSPGSATEKSRSSLTF